MDKKDGTIGSTFENRSILNQAMTREMRDAFLQYRAKRTGKRDTGYEEMAAYISSEDCVRDLKKLIERNYTMPPPFHYRLPKNLSGKRRDVYAWNGPVNYLLKLIVFVLHEYDSIFSDGLYSFRTSLTARDFLLKIRNHRDIGNYYIVKADVSNYVSSIVPELLIPQLSEIWGDDPAFLDLLKHLLLRRECIEKDGRTVACETGGLGGVPIANLFMNVYLMELDSYFYPRSPLYGRYSDDIILFARSLEEAEEYRARFLDVLERKKLSTNAEKTYLIEPGGEVEILGCKLKNGVMDISNHAKRKIKRKIRMYAKYILRIKKEKGLTNEECGRSMANYCNKVFFGQTERNALTWARWIFPVITDVSSLRELDHFVQDAIRYVMCGSFSKKRYRITYKHLRELGYRNIVHTYYHFCTDKFPADRNPVLQGTAESENA